MLLQSASVILSAICLVKADKLWRHVIVDEIHIYGSVTLATSFLNLWHCGASCDQNPVCTAWCHDGQTCILTKIWVSLLHSSITSSTKTCFTRLEKDYIVGSSVTSSPNNFATRTPSNLVKGIFDHYDSRTCADSAWNLDNPWMLFDLGSMKPIREVRIMTMNFDFPPELANAAQVKVGNLPPATAGDFSAFKYFGELPNPVQHSTTYILKREHPIKGRYLSLQKPGQSTIWVLCYVMAL